MNTNIPKITNRRRFWFYIRKGIFQGFFPIFLAFLTFTDFVNQMSNKDSGSSYNHLYFYTMLILFIYNQMKVALEYIFSICSEDVIFKKEINLTTSSPETLLTFMANEEEVQNEHFVIIIKKIFKLRYSNNPIFTYINKICWFLGMDCPLLIPHDIIVKLSNIKDEINEGNEEALLKTTLNNLYTYHPTKFNIVAADGNNNKEPLLPSMVITKTDKSIGEIKQDLFNKFDPIYDSAVI